MERKNTLSWKFEILENPIFGTQTFSKQNKGKDSCMNFDPGFENYYKYFSLMIELYKLPHINLLKTLVE